MRLKNNKFNLYLNYVSYYRPNTTINKLDPSVTKFSLTTIGLLLLYSSFFKDLNSTSKIVSFIVFPKYKRSFTLVKGPNGHKFGKYVFGYSHYRLLLLFRWPLDYFVSNNLFSNDYLDFFFFLHSTFSVFSNNIFTINKCRLVTTVNLNFL